MKTKSASGSEKMKPFIQWTWSHAKGIYLHAQLDKHLCQIICPLHRLLHKLDQWTFSCTVFVCYRTISFTVRVIVFDYVKIKPVVILYIYMYILQGPPTAHWSHSITLP